MSGMKCSKCNTDSIKNQANGKEFYFCQTCRIEVVDEDKTSDISTEFFSWNPQSARAPEPVQMCPMDLDNYDLYDFSGFGDGD